MQWIADLIFLKAFGALDSEPAVRNAASEGARFRRVALPGLALLSGFWPLAPAMAADPGPAPAPAPALASVADYQLGPGDKIRVITFGEDSLSGEFLVDDRGEVALPLIGNLEAAGLSPKEFQGHIQAALSQGYLKNPRVSVEVLGYRPFYILGEVNKPGEYPYTAGLTVLNAVATASGFTYRANTHKVYVKGDGDATEHLVTITAGLRVQPGDTIRIRERYF